MGSDIEYVRRDDVHHLRLARPDKANALSVGMVEALLEAVERAPGEGARLLVLSGEGRHFCAGFDFTGLEDVSDGDLVLRFVRVEQLLQALDGAPIPTLALAHGKVFGAGADIVACCARRVAAPGTTFLMPGPRFGVILGTRRLARRIGTARARAIQLASRSFDADEAAGMGFLDAVVPQDGWEEELDRAARSAATLDPAAVAAIMSATRDADDATDLAALVRSVARPGLKQRILDFRKG